MMYQKNGFPCNSKRKVVDLRKVKSFLNLSKNSTFVNKCKVEFCQVIIELHRLQKKSGYLKRQIFFSILVIICKKVYT